MTEFKPPSIITQVLVPNEITGRDSISWNNLNRIADVDSYAVTSKPLNTISGMWMEKFLSQTHEIHTSGYNFTGTGTVVGVEFLLMMKRSARIQDLLIQLTLNGELIGLNYASPVNPVQSNMYTAENAPSILPIGDNHTYGSPTDVWGTNLTAEQVSDPTFGIVIAFKSNEIVPHSDLVYLDRVALRITYA